MDRNKEKHIVDSYIQNAKPWITAISQQEIESRNLVTNQAIVDAILKQGPLKVLDIGCGEGWWLCLGESNATAKQTLGKLAAQPYIHRIVETVFE